MSAASASDARSAPRSGAGRIAVLAGEASGDLLGGALIEALKAREPDIECFGVSGPRMEAAGCESLDSIDSLSLMGISEVIGEIPRLMRLRKTLHRQIRERRPDCVVGIDAPDFNLGLEKRLRADGLQCTHLVSPTVWAWRAGRTKTVAAAAQQLLTLFPFEPACYANEAIDVRYIGHPLADELTPRDMRDARASLELPAEGQLLSVLPGSRAGEVSRLMEVYVGVGDWLLQRRPGLRFAVPVAKPSLRAVIEAAVSRSRDPSRWHLFDGQSREVVSAGDMVLVASGTATLECLLLGRPMVVAYRVSPSTAFLLRQIGMLKVDSVSLPNLLVGHALVPELLQDAATPEILGAQVYRLLARADLRRAQVDAFAEAAARLRIGAADRAAEAILERVRGA